MTSPWPLLTWGEICELRYGKALPGERATSGKTQVFGTNGPIGWTLGDPLASGPRPIVGRKGAYRGVHMADGPFWVIDTAYWLEPKETLDPVWAYYALLTVDINGMDSGSAIPSLTRDHFYAVPVALPPLSDQRRIAGVLGALDDLIEVNRALAGDCERLARSLVSTASATTTLSSFTTWGGLPTVKPAGQVDHYSLPAFDDEQTPERLDGSLIKSNKQQISQPCVLVARLNPHIPRVWMVYPDTAVSSLASTEFVAICAVGVPNEVVYAVCSTPTYLEQMNGLVTGTTGSHQRVDKDALTSVEVPDVRTLPAENLEAIALLVKQAHALRLEIRELSSTRDELLPLLMSGRVRVTKEVAV